ncbi:glycoside hydrolase family 30 protein [Ceratobasidium sp. AG-Ba]|nr:glycoside hydrolase family 30 protein [Ceratobasidium sp. AG-Ba]
MRYVALFAFSAGLQLTAAQTIYDINTWDRTKLLTRASDPAINFVAKGAVGDADIVVSDTTDYQQMDGFGATLTDSSALVLSQLKSKNLANYNTVLSRLFNSADGAATAGFGILCLSLGASDFSASAYSFEDTAGDSTFANFSLDGAPAYLWSTLKDIVAVNPRIKLCVLPWSSPAWMKSPASLNGGALQSQYNGVFAQYLFKTVQQLKAKGFAVYAINPQNEPENPNATYPTTSMPYTQEAVVGQALRPLLDNNGVSSVKIIGFEHNWDHAGQYPVSLMSSAGGSFAGAAFHCYGGAVSNQDLSIGWTCRILLQCISSFNTRECHKICMQTEVYRIHFPNKVVYMSECAGTIGSDWWSDIKWYMDNVAR